MVQIDFYPFLEEMPKGVLSKRLIFKDTTKNRVYTGEQINTLTIKLTSHYMPNKVYEADVMPYIYTERKNLEWFSLTSDQLGVSEGEAIPDGVYQATFYVNNAYQVTHSFMVIQSLWKEANAVLSKAGFSVDVSGTNLYYQHATKYDFELMAILYSLLGSLRLNMYRGDLEAAETAFLKAKRVLQTIETTGYEII